MLIRTVILYVLSVLRCLDTTTQQNSPQKPKIVMTPWMMNFTRRFGRPIGMASMYVTTTTSLTMLSIGMILTSHSNDLDDTTTRKMVNETTGTSIRNALQRDKIDILYHNMIMQFFNIPHTKCETNTSTDSHRHTGNTTTSIENRTTNTSSSTNDRMIFLGSGSSTGCPRPLCPLLFSNSSSTTRSGNDDDDGNHNDVTIVGGQELKHLRDSMIHQCRTSILASRGNPIDNKDYRNNPSLLLSIVDPTSDVDDDDTNVVVRHNVIIDVGKTFREGALRWLPKHSIRSIDAIILTHQHMDAAAGLDDVRGFQRYVMDAVTQKTNAIPMPLYLSDICLSCLQSQFPWLLPKARNGNEQKQPLDNSVSVQRHVASFDVTVFEAFQPFEPIPGFSVIPLPLVHGEDLISYGFAFSLGGTMNVVYLSDISRMLPETLDYIQNQLPQPIHVLVLDSLNIESTHPVHYCLPQSLELIQQLKPLQTYLVGMSCDSFGPHDERNRQLKEEYGNVQLAHDGLVIDAPTRKVIQ
jgi:phosphoribosyl 1,2-cyclic phosphodiesterase